MNETRESTAYYLDKIHGKFPEIANLTWGAYHATDNPELRTLLADAKYTLNEYYAKIERIRKEVE